MSDPTVDAAWRKDQDAEREIRALRIALCDAIESEAFRSRAHVDLDVLHELVEQLERDQAHIVAVWD